MKNILIITSLSLVFMVIFIMGCLSDSIMPAKRSPIADSYILQNDPCASKDISKGRNIFGLNNLEGAQQTAAYVKYIHQKNIARYEYMKSDDLVSYNHANNEAEQNLKEAQEMSNIVWGSTGIGTILASALLGGIAVRMHAVQTMSTDAEVKEKQNEAVENEKKILYTEAEYQEGIEKAKITT